MHHRTAATLVAAALLLSGCGAQDSPGGWTVASALAQLPAGTTADDYVITMADLAAALEQAGAEQGDSAEAVAAWLPALTRGEAASPEGAAVLVPVPDDVARLHPADFATITGFRLGQATSFAHIGAPPSSFTVFDGLGDGALAGSLIPLDGGIYTDIDGEDGVPDFTAEDALSQVRRPTRFAEDGGAVAMSSQTPTLREWLDGAGTLADDEALAEVAGALDRVGVVSALLTAPRTAAASPGMPETAFDTIGLGWSAGKVYVVYRFAAAPDAGQLEALWRDTTLLTGATVSEFVLVDGVAVDGNVATVTLSPAEGRSVGAPLNFLMSGEPLLTSP